MIALVFEKKPTIAVRLPEVYSDKLISFQFYVILLKRKLIADPLIRLAKPIKHLTKKYIKYHITTKIIFFSSKTSATIVLFKHCTPATKHNKNY